MTDADKATNPQHFGSHPLDIQIRITPEIRIRIPDHFRLTFRPSRSLRSLSVLVVIIVVVVVVVVVNVVVVVVVAFTAHVVLHCYVLLSL